MPPGSACQVAGQYPLNPLATSCNERPSDGLVLMVPVPDGGECGEGGVVGFGEGVEVFLGGDDAAVPESFIDGLEVGAAGEEPGGVGVA
jgi:hypothetical protein